MIDSPLKGKKVLVVDDEPELRSAIIFDLNRRGCIIFEAENGTDALKIVKTEGIEIVVSDVRMPNGTGIELLQSLRKNHTDIPFVLLATGFADLTEAEALKMGAQALIEKPIDRKKMLKLLEEQVLTSI